MKTAADWVRLLELTPHPEGGYFREIYRSADQIPAGVFPGRFAGPRSVSTSVYFCLGPGDRSNLHRIRADEIWHFYEGTALQIHCLFEDGSPRILRLGRKIEEGETFQAIIPAGCWFGAEGAGAGDWALFGCTVAPGFDFAEFELGRRDELLARFPDRADLIRRLTR